MESPAPSSPVPSSASVSVSPVPIEPPADQSAWTPELAQTVAFALVLLVGLAAARLMVSMGSRR